MSKKILKKQLKTLPFAVIFVWMAVLVAVENNKPVDTSTSFIEREMNTGREEKIESLEKFFEAQESPLKNDAGTFVRVAEKYGLDYRLLPAISCMESSCGKRIIPNSYNPFGWGVYGKHAIYFKSFEDAIETVGKGISEKYVSKGLDTPEKIAPVYTPPNPVGWKNGVNFFISKIEGPTTKDQTTLFSC
jgi:hypothetical protein